MLRLYLTPSSISYLTLFILSFVITTYLAWFILRQVRSSTRRQGRYLLIIFVTLVVFSLIFFLDYSLLPSDRPIVWYSQNTVVAILATVLMHFAYNFPAPNEKQKIEKWIALALSSGYILWEISFAVKRFSLLQTGEVIFRFLEIDLAATAAFCWVVFVFGRTSITHRKLPVARNFALIMLIPAALAPASFYDGNNPTITALFPILFSMGTLFATFLFALNYLTAQPERISFVVKISGVVLTSVLAVFGSIAWLVTPAYEERYQPPVLTLDHRTIHFRPDSQGGYQVEEVPFGWEENLGQPVIDPCQDITISYNFDFPFLGKTYQKIFVSNWGTIGLERRFHSNWYQYHFTPIPIIFPMLVWLGAGDDPDSGFFIRQDAEKVVLTWYKLRSILHGDEYTFQTILFSDGSFRFTYNGLPDMRFLANDPPETKTWVIGFKPASDPPGTANFSALPMHIGPEGALQDENRSFRIYLDSFLRPLAAAIVAGSLAFLAGMILMLYFNLARPLNTLLSGVQNFNQGRREKPIAIQSNDEIGFLTGSFNLLADELNELIRGLEQRVADRTQDLSVANRQLQSEIEARAAVQEQVVQHQRALAMLEERERLARELHDGIGQVLGFLNIQAQSASDHLRAGDRQAATQLLSRMAEVAQEAHNDVRGYILGLKKDAPARSCSAFPARLEQYCQYLSQNFGFQTTLHLPSEMPSMLASFSVEAQLLYIIREALSNARVHSGQKNGEVTITFDETNVQAVIADDGRGFVQKTKEGHFGLEIMRERASGLGGWLEVDSAPGRGTRVAVCLPRLPGERSAFKLRVLLVDDHPLFLEGLANLVAGRGMEVAGVACDGLEAQQKARGLHPDVILMDIDMPRCDGLEATRRIKAEMPEVKVVMLTVSGEERHLFEALRYGASGYLLKSLKASELTALLEELLRGEVSVSPGLASSMLEAFTRYRSPQAQAPGVPPEKERLEPAPQPVELTPRQIEILRLVAQGCLYKEIGLQLGLAEVTIKYHMGEILARLHLNSRREAVQFYQSGRVAPGS